MRHVYDEVAAAGTHTHTHTHTHRERERERERDIRDTDHVIICLEDNKKRSAPSGRLVT